jgi:hypothetical protein
VFEQVMSANHRVLTFLAGAARSHAARGEILLRSGKSEEGRRGLEQAEREQFDLVEKSPNNFDFNMQLARTRRALGL